MPCYDARDDEPSATREEIQAHRRHNSPEAEMLCEIMQTIIPEDYSEAIQKWWKEHQERDNLRNTDKKDSK